MCHHRTVRLFKRGILSNKADAPYSVVMTDAPFFQPTGMPFALDFCPAPSL